MFVPCLLKDPTSDAENIPTSSSHSVIITSLMTPADKQPSTKTYKMTTKPYQPYQLSTTSYHSSTTVSPTKNVDDEQNKDNTNTNDTPGERLIKLIMLTGLIVLIRLFADSLSSFAPIIIYYLHFVIYLLIST